MEYMADNADQMKHYDQHLLLASWQNSLNRRQKIDASSTAPLWSDLRPDEFLSCLGDLSLLELSERGPRFKMAASALETALGLCLKDQLFSDVFTDQCVLQKIEAKFSQLDIAEPNYGHMRVDSARSYAWLRLPLSTTCPTVRLILSYDRISSVHTVSSKMFDITKAPASLRHMPMLQSFQTTQPADQTIL